MRIFFFLLLSVLAVHARSQTVSDRLGVAYSAFEADEQLKSALSSLFVVDAVTGKTVFDRNSRIGLAPASTQKIITAAAAYESLGKDFRYQTTFAKFAVPENPGAVAGLFIKPSGDPTLGSWRWKSTSADSVLNRILAAASRSGVSKFRSLWVDARGWEGENIPGGWIWDDIGNYYGAGAAALNWHENQYDLILRSGDSIGSPVSVVGMRPAQHGFKILSNARAAAKGTGDNAYIYFRANQPTGVLRGTIPVGERSFTISGATPAPAVQFLHSLDNAFVSKRTGAAADVKVFDAFAAVPPVVNASVFHTEVSPPLDSICYWFLRRSINLYGEALAKTIAAKKGRPATTEAGVDEMEQLWVAKKIGIDESELHLYDGSGLSPLNRVTTHAQVAALLYAQKQSWFPGFAAGFPVFNGMQLKSGTISRVKSFCGYHTSKEGKHYVLSFVVNNYSGSSSAVVQKMYRVLDVLK